MPSSTRLILALTALISGTKAWYPCYPAPLTLAQIIGEPQCLSNETAFHTFNEVYVPVSLRFLPAALVIPPCVTLC